MQEDRHAAAVLPVNLLIRLEVKPFALRHFDFVHQQDAGADQIDVAVNRNRAQVIQPGRIDGYVTVATQCLRALMVHKHIAAVLILREHTHG